MKCPVCDDEMMLVGGQYFHHAPDHFVRYRDTTDAYYAFIVEDRIYCVWNDSWCGTEYHLFINPCKLDATKTIRDPMLIGCRAEYVVSIGDDGDPFDPKNPEPFFSVIEHCEAAERTY